MLPIRRLPDLAVHDTIILLEFQENLCIKINPLFAKSKRFDSAQSLVHKSTVVTSAEHSDLKHGGAAVRMEENKTLVFRLFCPVSCLLGTGACRVRWGGQWAFLGKQGGTRSFICNHSLGPKQTWEQLINCLQEAPQVRG